MAKKTEKIKLEKVDDKALSDLMAKKLTMPSKPEEAKDVEKEKTEDPKFFREGIVPPGFTKTYGDELFDGMTGQAAELIDAAHLIFKKEDGFRFFMKFQDNFRFTILLPLKFSNADSVLLARQGCDARSCVLRQGNTAEQVKMHCLKVARHIAYKKNQ